MNEKRRILELLCAKKNVLLTGAPGTGKSMLMNQVADIFESGFPEDPVPSHVIGGSVPVPAVASEDLSILDPIFKKQFRKVFRTTFHQNSKYRDFVTGIVPNINDKEGFHINEGILYRANEFARGSNSAALLIIDELNRGPAIEVFGGSIVAIESDKRTSDDNEKKPTTQYFNILSPQTGNIEEYALSPNLYILAAMNQADASVAPLDVAFLRRWQPYALEPDYDSLYQAFGVAADSPLPTICNSEKDSYKVAIEALKRLNELIVVGRGEAYQIGQGVLLSSVPSKSSKQASLIYLTEVWPKFYAHLEELFFGDTNAIGFLINAKSDLSPYKLSEVTFAGEDKTVLKHSPIDESNVFNLFLAIAQNNQ